MLVLDCFANIMVSDSSSAGVRFRTRSDRKVQVVSARFRSVDDPDIAADIRQKGIARKSRRENFFWVFETLRLFTFLSVFCQWQSHGEGWGFKPPLFSRATHEICTEPMKNSSNTGGTPPRTTLVALCPGSRRGLRSRLHCVPPPPTAKPPASPLFFVTPSCNTNTVTYECEED